LINGDSLSTSDTLSFYSYPRLKFLFFLKSIIWFYPA